MIKQDGLGLGMVGRTVTCLLQVTCGTTPCQLSDAVKAPERAGAPREVSRKECVVSDSAKCTPPYLPSSSPETSPG
jgi:hypothetical protein